MSVGAFMLSEKSRVGLSFATLALLIVFIITTSASAGSWKTSMELEIQDVREDVDDNTADLEVIKPAVVGMSKDIEWMRKWMENRE